LGHQEAKLALDFDFEKHIIPNVEHTQMAEVAMSSVATAEQHKDHLGQDDAEPTPRIWVSERIREAIRFVLQHCPDRLTPTRLDLYRDLSLSRSRPRTKAPYKVQTQPQTTTISKNNQRDSMTLAQVQELSRDLIAFNTQAKQRSDPSKPCYPHPYLHELLHGTLPVLPPPPPPITRTKEQEEKLERLRVELENRRYNKMVHNVVGTRQSENVRVRGEMKQFYQDISHGVNMLAMMIAAFVAGYFVFGPAVGGSTVQGVIGGVICGTIMMLVEMLLVVIRGSRIDKKEAEKQQKASLRAIAENKKRRPPSSLTPSFLPSDEATKRVALYAPSASASTSTSTSSSSSSSSSSFSPVFNKKQN